MEQATRDQRPAGVKTRPQLVKADRGELQERQKPKGFFNNVADKHRRLVDTKPVEAKSTISSKDSASARSTDAEHVFRGLRTFAHFVPSGKSLTSGNNKVEVEIHPAILCLALHFSEFRIVGGNARCIATVAALKEVHFFATSFPYHAHCSPGYT
jgi:translation initiation factor eIF-2B subunit delta